MLYVTVLQPRLYFCDQKKRHKNETYMTISAHWLGMITSPNIPVTAVLIGAGNRGLDVYGRIATKYSNLLRFVAVADPDPSRRAMFAEEHHLPPERVFKSWSELFEAGRMADAAFVCTQDQLHTTPTLAALAAGYHVLLEKPMATTVDECVQISTAPQPGQILQICHVLRYTPFYSTVAEVVRSGQLGRIVDVSMRENVSHWHYAHSFIRGNWHNRALSSPMILAKCCHDLDIMQWLVGEKARYISSFGSLQFFGLSNKPFGALERCIDGCPVKDCLWDARRIYLDLMPPPYAGWPINVLTNEPTSLENRVQALQEGPYGRCVFQVNDHDVVDHQVVSVEFSSGVTGSLTMQGHSPEEGRTIRVTGTYGTLVGDFGPNAQIKLQLNTGGESDMSPTYSHVGHGGGDLGLVEDFVQLIKQGRPEGLTSGRQSLESHLMAFAADQARLARQVVDMTKYRQQVGG